MAPFFRPHILVGMLVNKVKDGKGVALGWGMVGREINDPAIARMPPTRHQGMAFHPTRCNKTQSNQQATNNKPKKYVWQSIAVQHRSGVELCTANGVEK